MITREVNKFMILAPLMLPKLIDCKKCQEPDLTEDSAILYFSLEEPFPIGCVMDMLEDDMDLLLLYHGTKKESPRIHHCCFFASPKTGQSMYKINVTTDSREFDVRTIFLHRILHGKNCGELASLRVENSNTINVLDGEIDFLEDLGSLAACSKGIDRDGHAYTYGDKNYYGIYNHCFKLLLS